MNRLFAILFLLPLSVQAKAPECPIFKNKEACLKSVSDNYEGLIDYINKLDAIDKEHEMIEAAKTIKKYETFACERTCLK